MDPTWEERPHQDMPTQEGGKDAERFKRRDLYGAGFTVLAPQFLTWTHKEDSTVAFTCAKRQETSFITKVQDIASLGLCCNKREVAGPTLPANFAQVGQVGW